jgi:DNA-binding XRE family transcriptional regulator
MRLNEYLQAYDLTPADFAAKIGGVTSEAVRLWAAGKRMPEVRLIERIIEVTGNKVRIEDLFHARLEAMANE